MEITVKDNTPLQLEIDTEILKEQIYGKIPIRLQSEHDQAFFSSGDAESNKMYWHDKESSYPA